MESRIVCQLLLFKIFSCYQHSVRHIYFFGFQANIQRCKLIMDQLEESKANMLKVLEHKQKISEIINKHVSKRPIKKKERS